MEDDTTKQQNLLLEFQSQIVKFLDELIESFPYVTDFFIGRIFIKDQVDPKDLLGRFIRDLLPLQAQVKSRDERFFMENSLLLTKGQVDENRVDQLKQLWLSQRLDDQDRQIIWRWMDLFMKIADTYHKSFGAIEGWE